MNIPIEQIKAEIERLKGQLIRGACAAQIEMETNCKEEAYEEVLSFLSTLESEKPMNQKGVDVTDFCKPIDPDIAQCVADHWWEMLGEDEKPIPNDLEEATEEYVLTLCNRADEGLRIDTTLESAFKAGAEWMAEQAEKYVIERACEWLSRHYDIDLARFRKAMEED